MAKDLDVETSLVNTQGRGQIIVQKLQPDALVQIGKISL